MFCKICSSAPLDRNNTDCVIDALEKIRDHYNYYKINFLKNKASTENLKIENANLQIKVAELQEKLQLKSPRKKCRKTKSLDDNNTSEFDKSNKSLLLSSNTSSESVTDQLVSTLNQAMDITDINWSEPFFTTQQPKVNEVEMPTTPKKLILNDQGETINQSPSQRKALSPYNRNSTSSNTKVTLSSPSKLDKTYLPRRLKLSTLKSKKMTKIKNLENKKPNEDFFKLIESKTPKESKSTSTNETKNHKLGLSFIQGEDSFLNTSNKTFMSKKCTTEKEAKKSSFMNSPNKSPKLRQTRLIFDHIRTADKKSIDPNETFCDDFVQPSPTAAFTSVDEISKVKMINIGVPSRKKSNNESDTVFDKSSSSSVSAIIEKPPASLSKNTKSICISKLKSEKNEPTLTMSGDSSSVMILPSQADDVIIIDDTNNADYSKLSADQLIDEFIAPKYNETQTYLKKSEQERENHKKEKELEKIFSTSSCKECQEYYKFLSRHLSIDEIKTRLSSCKHKVVISSTPENFWDPVFRPFADDDPRNETLVHEFK